MKVRKKPVVVDTIQWTGDNMHDVIEFSECSDAFVFPCDESKHCFIETRDALHRCKVGDYIIKGVNGEFYPCKPDFFAATYEHVDD